MKKFLKHRYTFIFSLLLAGSCNSDFLERRPRNLIIEADAYGSESGLVALTSRLYNDMTLEDFDYQVAEDAGFLTTVTDESVRSYTWDAGTINGTTLGNWFGAWDYYKIRRLNDFLEKIPKATVSDEIKSRFSAEVRFIRAYQYFQMVKRYGGVPLVTTVKQYTSGEDPTSLFVARNTEKEVYDFIAKELDEIIETLPGSYDADNKNRITKYAAYALKSRAMMYAASIAKYGDVQINGLVGIPAQDAEYYWNASLEASRAILSSNNFSLFNEESDKVLNFQNLFLRENSSEVIFNKVYKTPEVAHSYDFFNAPQSFKVDYGCVINPTLDFVEDFEYTDGTSGELKLKDASGNPIQYTNPYDIFKNKDPRLLASIMVPFSAWQGGVLEIRRGVMKNGARFTAENTSTGYPESGSSFKLVGKDGPLTTNDPTKTGFYVKKSMDPTKRVNYGESTTPYILFRLGEILLNYAEASYELNQTSNALMAINLIRERAGIASLKNLTLDKIRHERKIELAFENHRFWDIRRWRIATEVLNNTQFHALYPWIIWEEGKSPSEMKYVFEKVPAPKNPRTFPHKLYYEPVPQGNPTYIQNPLY